MSNKPHILDLEGYTLDLKGRPLVAANQSNPPEIYAIPAPDLSVPEILTQDIIDSLLREMRARLKVLAYRTNISAEDILESNVRAFGRVFLATLATLPKRDQARLIEEFDLLTLQFLK